MLPPPSPLTPVERVRRENRWNMPFGFGSSFIVHALFILLLLFVAATYIESGSRSETTQSSQNVVVQTLIRQPQPKAQPPKPRPTPRPVTVHRVVSVPVPVELAAKHGATPQPKPTAHPKPNPRPTIQPK